MIANVIVEANVAGINVLYSLKIILNLRFRIREHEARRRPHLAKGQAFALDLRAKAADEIGGKKGGLKAERMEQDTLN